MPPTDRGLQITNISDETLRDYARPRSPREEFPAEAWGPQSCGAKKLRCGQANYHASFEGKAAPDRIRCAAGSKRRHPGVFSCLLSSLFLAACWFLSCSPTSWPQRPSKKKRPPPSGLRGVRSASPSCAMARGLRARRAERLRSGRYVRNAGALGPQDLGLFA